MSYGLVSVWDGRYNIKLIHESGNADGFISINAPYNRIMWLLQNTHNFHGIVNQSRSKAAVLSQMLLMN